MQLTDNGEKVFFFLMKLCIVISNENRFYIMQNTGFSLPTTVYWSTWPHCEGKFHILGMCDILRRSGDTSTNVWKCELKEVYLNLIKVYGQSLQNILEIPIYIPK